MNDLDVLRTNILQACSDGDGPFLYRGESADYLEVSSTLRRKSSEWRRNVHRNLNDLQKNLTAFADGHDNPEFRPQRESEKYIAIWSGGYDPGEFSEREVEIMGDLQHWGAATNLIDFTTDVDVAIYFACEEKWSCDGRIVIVQRRDWVRWELPAKSPPHRVIAQKSVFIRPPDGTVKPWKIIDIRRGDKPLLLEQLGQLDPPVSPARVYNDIYGYTRLNDRYIQGADCYHEARAILNRYTEEFRRGKGSLEMVEEAKRLLKISAEKLFTKPSVWAELGRASYAANELAEAKSALEKAVRLGYHLPEARLLLADIAIKEGNTDAARQHAQAGLALCREADGKRVEQKKEMLENIVRIAAGEE